MNDTAGRERRAAARFTELVLNGLYEDCQAGGEFASEVMYEALHEVRNEFGNDDLELRDLIQPPTHPASAAGTETVE